MEAIRVSTPEPPASPWGCFKDLTVLVTGGAGFIGSCLTERLVESGARVTIVDHLHARSVANLARCRDRVECVQEDILSDRFRTLMASRSFEVIFHLAGNPYVPPSVEDPWHDFQLNLEGTLRLLESVRKSGSCPRVLIASSAAVYGDLDVGPITEEHPTVPISPYGVSKLAAERYGAVYARLYGMRIASLRFFSVYGPRQRKQVVYDLLRKFSSGAAEVEVFGNGTQVRDFNYVSDVVDATLTVADAGALAGEVYNVAGGQECSLRELVGLLSDVLGVRPRIRWSGAVRPGEPQRFLADYRRLAGLGWRPKIALREGLQRTLSWYRSEDDDAERGAEARRDT